MSCGTASLVVAMDVLRCVWGMQVRRLCCAEFAAWGLRGEYTIYDQAMNWKQTLPQTG